MTVPLRYLLNATIWGILDHFDLPELALTSGCENVVWKSPSDQNGVPLERHGLYTFETLITRLSGVFGMEGKAMVAR